KIVATASRALLIVVDQTKLVEHLGSHFAIPIEVVPFGWQTTASRLADLGATPNMRIGENGQPFISDGGHYILDCRFPTPIGSAEKLDERLNDTLGVVEHGLFLGLTSKVFIGSDKGVQIISATRT